MKKLFYLFVFMLFTTTVQGQNVLKGNVYFISSGHKPAIGVHVRDKEKLSNGDYSKNGGEFTLEFSSTEINKYITLALGEEKKKLTNALGQELEWVNESDFSYLSLGKHTSDKPLKIIVCPKGGRDLAAQRYYKVIKTSADIELAKRKRELEEFFKQQKKDFAKISEMGDQIDKMEKQIDSLLIMKEAYRIASINRDDAGQRVLKYLQLLEEGKSIQEARKVLNPQAAVADLKKSQQLSDNAIKELETRAAASIALFDYEDAILCRKEIVDFFEISRKDPLLIAVQYFELGSAYDGLGQYPKALEYYEKSLKIMEQTLDANHPNITALYNNIGTIYPEIGQYQNALTYLEKSLKILEQTSSADYGNIARLYNNIGSVYSDLDKHQESLEYHRKALNLRKKNLDANHLDISTSYNNIGVVYQKKGHNHEALSYYEKALNIMKQTLDANHPDIATLYNNIGVVHGNLKQCKEALSYLKQALKIRYKVLVNFHPNIAQTYNNIGSVFASMNQYLEALDYHEKALEIWQQTSDVSHFSIATSYNNIGGLYFMMGKYPEALKYLKISFNIFEKNSDVNYLMIAILHRTIAETYSHMEQYSKALEQLEKSLRIYQEKLDDDHSEMVGILYNSMGVNYLNLDQFKNAIIYFSKSNEINPIFENLNSIGLCYYHLKEYSNAITYYKQAASLSEEDVKEGLYFANIGIAYTQNRQFKEAKIALDNFQELFPEMGVAYLSWAMYYALKGEKEEALQNLQKAIELGYNDLEFIENDDSLGSIINEQRFKEIVRRLKKG